MADSKKVVWKSITALMQKHYGGENLTRLAKDCKFGPGTSTRLKEQKTSVGLDVLDKIAKKFGVDTWQLLVPGFNPNSIPTLQPISEQERKLYERLAEVVREVKEGP